MTEQEPRLALPSSLGQTLLDYLASQPYKDVYQLVAALQQLRPVEDPAGPPEAA